MSDAQPKVTMGRVVFYVKTTGLVRSAHVSHVHEDDGTVNLTVFDSNGSIFGVSRVRYSEVATKTNTWHWPPRV